MNKKFDLNLSLKKYSKLFDDFSKNIKQGKTYQIKIAQTYSKKGNVNAVELFWKLMKMNESPESFLIRDKNFNILEKNQKGLVQLISLLPTSYPGHNILTEDVGEIIDRKKQT